MRWSGTFICVLLAWANLLLAAEPVADRLNEAIAQAEQGEHTAAVETFAAVIRAQPESPEPYYWRGRSLFCLGQVKTALADFDRYVALAPKREPQQWERGIALYYAGEFARGAKQFELYQTYHDNDVENSAWRYLCVARDKGSDEAKKTLLPIRNDRRVPMMQIYDLYAGKLTPEEVLAVAEKEPAAEQGGDAPRFYAHLYIGLWHEAGRRTEQASQHLALANRYRIGHYMGDVARVHQALRQQK